MGPRIQGPEPWSSARGNRRPGPDLRACTLARSVASLSPTLLGPLPTHPAQPHPWQKPSGVPALFLPALGGPTGSEEAGGRPPAGPAPGNSRHGVALRSTKVQAPGHRPLLRGTVAQGSLPAGAAGIVVTWSKWAGGPGMEWPPRHSRGRPGGRRDPLSESRGRWPPGSP